MEEYVLGVLWWQSFAKLGTSIVLIVFGEQQILLNYPFPWLLQFSLISEWCFDKIILCSQTTKGKSYTQTASMFGEQGDRRITELAPWSCQTSHLRGHIQTGDETARLVPMVPVPRTVKLSRVRGNIGSGTEQCLYIYWVKRQEGEQDSSKSKWPICKCRGHRIHFVTAFVK